MKRRLFIAIAALASISAVATDPIDRTIAHLDAISMEMERAKERVIANAAVIPEQAAYFKGEAAGLARAQLIVQERIDVLRQVQASGR